MRFGSLFSGYGGLDMGVQSVLGGTTAWFCEFDKAPSKILAHHWPDVPNLGDITAVDWGTVEPVDVLTGGSPCQDLSHAGKRAGMTEGTRSNLWVQMREAIDALRPRLVVWENVRGALSAPADSDLEPCPGCVGGPDDGPVLRALGRVLGDLSELGYDTWWTSLRAADVGAAHGRFRVFLFAWPADADPDDGLLVTGRRDVAGAAPSGQRSGARGGVGPADRGRGDAAEALTLLPTPAVNDMGASYTPETWDAWTATMQAKHGNGNGHGKSLAIEAQRLLPTPSVADATGGHATRSGDRSSELLLPGVARAYAEERLLPTPRTQNNENRQSEGYGGKDGNFHGLLTGQSSWGDYAPAIVRWESATGRTAPAPTEPGKNGNPRLSPAFVEWLMGLPAGHVTDTGLTRNEQLKALGNGVVPQQAAAATRWWLTQITQERAA